MGLPAAHRIVHRTAILLAVLCLAPAALAGTFSQEAFSGRTYWLYVPSSYSAGTPAPLVMMLHGCTQSGDGFATSTGMNAVADVEGFLVAYPQQPSSANSSQCWNWFETVHQSRGSGEPAHLAGVVGDISGSYSVDSDGVYVAGFSAGAAMAVILGATFPDVFQAIGVHSGLEYKAATSATAAFTAMFSGGPPADPQGQLAYNAMGSRARVVPVMVFHGTSDFTVVTANGDLALSQWAQTNDLASDGVDQDDIDDTAELVETGQVPGGRSFTRSVYEDSQGNVVMEKYLVDSMGHNWSGGVLGGTYTDPDGPDASQILADFFLGGGGPAPDTTPPVTTASPTGGNYSGTIAVTLTVNEAATTYYTTDGSTPTTASTVYTSPINLSVNTTLNFFSVDTAGNAEAVQSEAYTFSSGGDTTPPVTTASPAGGTYSGSVDVTLTASESATTYYTTDGSTPTIASAVYSSPITLSANTTLQFFSVDTAGNAEVVQSETYTISTASSLTLTSIDSEDGTAGQLWADGVTTTLHRVGDKGMFNSDTYRLILSFDTSAIPSGATLTAATLKLYRSALAGTVTQLTADVATTTFGSTALTQSDYSAAATQTGAFTVAVPASNGASTETPLPSSVLPLLHGSRFQVRLRATTPINFASDVLTVHGGGAGALAPTLEVSYQ